MFFVYGVYNNSLEMMFIRLGLLTGRYAELNNRTRKGVSRKNNIISIVYENSFLLIHLFP